MKIGHIYNQILIAIMDLDILLLSKFVLFLIVSY